MGRLPGLLPPGDPVKTDTRETPGGPNGLPGFLLGNFFGGTERTDSSRALGMTGEFDGLCFCKFLFILVNDLTQPKPFAAPPVNGSWGIRKGNASRAGARASPCAGSLVTFLPAQESYPPEATQLPVPFQEIRRERIATASVRTGFAMT